MRLHTTPGSPTGRGRHISKRTGVGILLAAFVISLAVGIADLRKSERLRKHGLVTKARLAAKQSRTTKHHYIDIEYRTATGQIVSARDDVSASLHNRMKIGDTISVRYLPTQPDVHALGSTPRRDTFMLWLAGMWVFLTFLYVLFGK